MRCIRCSKTLSSAQSLDHHSKNYCRYREGKKVGAGCCRQRDVVVVNDGHLQGRTEGSRCVAVSGWGRVRDYEILPRENDVNPRVWVRSQEGEVREIVNIMDEFVVRGRMVLRCWFIKRNNVTGQVLRRELFDISSLSTSTIDNFHEWFTQHTAALFHNLDTFNKRDSELELDGIDALELKLTLLPNDVGYGFFKLPGELKRKQAVINIQTEKDCFHYALLSILHYNDLSLSKRT